MQSKSALAPWSAGVRVARLFLLATCMALAGCGTVTKITQAGASLIGLGPPKPVLPDWKSVVLAASPDANDNSPLALDLVFVRDPALVDSLMTTPSAKWFAVRGDTQRAFPEALGVISFEVVPGQYIRLSEKAWTNQRALAVFVFASYPSPGAHRERLVLAADSYLLQLGSKGFKASEAKPADVK